MIDLINIDLRWSEKRWSYYGAVQLKKKYIEHAGIFMKSKGYVVVG